MALPPPPISVTAEEVEAGKPDPTCYNLGRERIGVSKSAAESGTANARVLVVEDAPAGIKAGKAAGCEVLGLATTHSIESVLAAGADWVVKDLESLKVVGKKDDGSVEIRLLNGWVPFA
ncbi:MAG: hypothetical protein LQ340_000385 [Diploschistes diacapsis]|nr:MAG: hypothetical protein LQ340_000385 [Diploschistes diacapsis]